MARNFQRAHSGPRRWSESHMANMGVRRLRGLRRITPPPEVKSFPTVAAEARSVRETVATWLGGGIAAHEIGLFVRTSQLVVRARVAIDGLAGAAEMVIAQMSLAKGPEFRAVVVMACDEGILPLDERVADAADEAELDDIYKTERLHAGARTSAAYGG
jgi:superfamily I DNA/RNA helicase